MAVEYAGQFNAEFTDKIINWEAKVVDINTDIQGKNDLGESNRAVIWCYRD
jgi:hypothetical protein